MNKFTKVIAALMLIVTAIIVAGCNKPDEPNNGGNNGNNDSDVRVTTYTPQDITANSAVCGGDVIAVQGLSLSEIGVCWSTQNNPTIDDSHVSSEQWNQPFVCVISDLEPERQYYVRAYALRGLMCYYGDVLSFTTLENNTGGNDTILGCLPSIHVLQEVGYLQNGQLVDIGYDEQLTIPFGFVMASNPQTNKALKHLKVDVEDFDLEGVSLDFFNLADKDIEGTSYTYEDVITFQFIRDLIGRIVITAIVTDAAGETASASINFSINLSVPPLEVKQFTWIRRGSSFLNNTEEEMAEFGLYWSGNYKDVFATIKPLEGSILYVCNGDDFWNITTDVEKAAYLASLSETTSPVVSYRNVTISNSADYNDLLVVLEDGNVHLILISRAEIENGIYGTQVSIMGEAK